MQILQFISCRCRGIGASGRRTLQMHAIKIVQISRADDIRHYNIVLIYNKKELHTAVPFYYSDFYYISVLARGTRSGFGVGIAEGYRADSAQGFGQIPLAQ